MNHDIHPSVTFTVDRLVGEASAGEYDALILPGGAVNPENLRQDEAAVGFVRDFVDSGKPVGVICHGPWTLVEAGVVQGRTLTSYPSVRTDIRNAGGNVVDQEVVTDQNITSSRRPDDLPAFRARIVEQFATGRTPTGQPGGLKLNPGMHHAPFGENLYANGRGCHGCSGWLAGVARLIRNAAWRPRSSGRGGNAASPPRKCQRCPIVSSHVQVPAAPHTRPAGGAARALRACPVRVEPRRRAAHPLAPRPESAPGYREQCARAHPGAGGVPVAGRRAQTVQQQALRDFAQAMTAFVDPGNPAGSSSWRKAGRDEGFRIVGRGRQWEVRRVSRKVGQVWVPKAGWVRFRWSRAVPPGAKSYRVTMDRAGRWHVAFAVIPAPVPAPGNGQAVGIDRGWSSPRPCPPASSVVPPA